MLTHRQTAPLALQDQPALGPATLIVTLGDEGALLVEGSTSHRIRAHRVKPVDTTAAGDAFVGAFAAALAEEKPVLEAASWGNAAGALSVTSAGAQPSLPTRERLESFLASSPAEIVQEKGNGE
jgi:ribokinase